MIADPSGTLTLADHPRVQRVGDQFGAQISRPVYLEDIFHWPTV